MSLPNFQEMMLPALQAFSRVSCAKIPEIEKSVADTLNLSEEQKSELLPSGGETTLHNRTAWAVFDLFQAGLLQRIRRGTYAISDAGKALLEQKPEKITRDFLKQYPSFMDFINRSHKNRTEMPQHQQDILDEIDPETQLDSAVGQLNDKLHTDLLEELKRADPVFFERIILDLFKAMNYGEGKMTSKSHDGGIDGTIYEDILGLSRIYMQAKRYAGNKVNEKEMQNFVGALGSSEVSKGVFVTTNFFDDRARKKAADAAKKGMIIRLIDGEELTKLMIKHNIGVRTMRKIEIKIVDTAYFMSGDE